MDGAFALSEDGSVKDPRGFQQAIRDDAAKMAELEKVLALSALEAAADFTA
jgi:hypothetical protein